MGTSELRLAYSYALKMEAAHSSETSVNTYQTTWLTSKKTNLYVYCHEIFKCYN
jgi:hypothetical protein